MEENICLVVTSAVGYAILYQDLGDLTQFKLLPAIDDSVTCSLAYDVDFDGIPEILVGTYSQ